VEVLAVPERADTRQGAAQGDHMAERAGRTEDREAGGSPAPRILVVDDEPNVLLVLERVLERAGFDTATAPDGETALRLFGERGAELILSDLVMPGMDGIELLRRARELDPGVAFILLTGVSSIQDVASALELGADHYLRKPFDVEEVRFAVERALRYARLVRENEALRRLAGSREETGEAREAAPPPALPAPRPDAATVELELGDMLQLVSSVVDLRYGDPGRHSSRMVRLTAAIGRRLGLEEAALSALSTAAVLYDLGTFGIPDRILEKRGPLSAEEYEVVKRHPTIGAQIVARSEALHAVVAGVLHHHERWDGGGYPDGLAGPEIPPVARILAVADTFVAITTDRPYRPRRPARVALQELRRGAGTQFDPAVVDATLAVLADDGPGEAAIPPILPAARALG
jgi:response regulator RpfG family c-di-GMP phosphodiesterase